MASAIERARALETRAEGPHDVGDIFFRRSVFVDGQAGADDSLGVSLQLADFWSRPKNLARGPIERLGGQWDVAAHATVADGTRKLGDLALWQRARSYMDLDHAEWRDDSQRLAFLDDSPVFPGLGRRLIAAFDSVEDRLVLDALLQLAPGYVQILAAVIDRRLKLASATRDSVENSGVADIGGLPDSCYMWRSDGPLSRRRAEPGDDDL